jgi:transcriptional regulator with XRE-family HTH domain
MRQGQVLETGEPSVTEQHLSFADRLRTQREAAGLSQYALAKKSGLTKQALSRLELGEREPTWATVQLLALALGVDCRSFTDPNLRTPPQADEPPRGRGRPRKATQETPAKKGKGKK